MSPRPTDLCFLTMRISSNKDGSIVTDTSTRDGKQVFTIPLRGASSNKKINQIPLAIDDHWKRKFFSTIESCYSRATHYEFTIEFLRTLIDQDHRNIGELAMASVQSVCGYAGLDTEFRQSSVKYQNADLKGQARILDICAQEQTEQYVNAPGGRGLYDSESFDLANVELRFLASRLEPYDQFGGPFEPALSILDVMMFVGPTELADLCSRYTLED